MNLEPRSINLTCGPVLTEVAVHVVVRIAERCRIGLAQHHVALTRLHVLQATAPASGVASLGEVGKLGVTLNHVARLSMVVVIAQSCLHGQVRHRCVANSVPSLLEADGAFVLILDDGTANWQGAVLLDLDGIRLRRRDGHAFGAARSNPLFTCCLVGHRQCATQLGHCIAIAPALAAQQLVHVAQLVALQVERHPVPALLQLEVLDEGLATVEAHGLVGAKHGILGERDGLARRQHDLTTCAVLPQAEVQFATTGLAVIDGQVEASLARLRVVRDVGKAVALVLAVEHAHDVA